MTVRQVALRLGGTIAIAAAVGQVASGARGVRGFDWRVASGELPSSGLASLDSELRFYAVWYGVAGALMHRAANDEVLDRAVSTLVAAGWAAAALGRLLSARATGRPDPLFIALGGAEAAMAALLATRTPRS